MSKFFKRIGTKATKFSYEAEIQQVNLNIGISCYIKVHWKRGSHSTSTSRSVQLNHRTGKAAFSESLTLDATLYQSKKTESFQEKTSVFTVILESQKGDKQGGQVSIDLSELPNSGKTSKVYEVTLDKCPDKSATLKFMLTVSKIGDVNESQISESDRDNENSFRSQNLKGVSIGSGGAFEFEKRAQGIDDMHQGERGRSASREKEEKKNDNNNNHDDNEEDPEEQRQRIADEEKLKRFEEDKRKRQQSDQEEQKKRSQLEQKDEQLKQQQQQLEKQKQLDQQKQKEQQQQQQLDLEKRRLQDEEDKRAQEEENRAREQEKKEEDEFAKRKAELNRRQEEFKRKQKEMEEAAIKKREYEEEQRKKEEQNRKQEAEMKFKKQQQEQEEALRAKAEALKKDRQAFLNQNTNNGSNLVSLASPKFAAPSSSTSGQQKGMMGLQNRAPVNKLKDEDDEDEDEGMILVQSDEDDDNGLDEEETKTNNVGITSLQRPPANPKSMNSNVLSAVGRNDSMDRSKGILGQDVPRRAGIFQNNGMASSPMHASKSPRRLSSIDNSNPAPFSVVKNVGNVDQSRVGQANAGQLQQKAAELAAAAQKIQEMQNENEQLKRALNSSSNGKGAQDGKSSLLQLENDRLKQKNAELNQQIARINGDAAQTASNFKMLEAKHKNMVSDFQNLRKEYQDNKEILESLKDEQSSMSSQSKTSELELKKRLEKITSQQEEITRLRNEQTKAESENFKLTKKLQELDMQLKNASSSSNSENQELNRNVSSLREQLNDKEKLINEAKDQARRSEDERQNIQNEFNKQDLRCRQLEMECNKLKSRLQFMEGQTDRENQSHKREVSGKDEEIDQLKQRILQLLEEKSQKGDQEESAEQILQLEKKNQYQAEYISRLENQVKDGDARGKEVEAAEMKAAAIQEELEATKSNFNRQAKRMTDVLQGKDKDIEEKQKRIRELENRLLEDHKAQAAEKDDELGGDNSNVSVKYQELKRKYKQLREKTDQEREEQNLRIEELKLQLRPSTRPINIKDSSSNNVELDAELAKLSVENEQLQRKIKDLTAKQSKTEQNGELMKAYKKLEVDYKLAKDELIQVKMSKTTGEKKVDDSKALIEGKEKKIQELEGDLQAMQKDLIRTKQKYGDALNICLEQGGPELVDKIIRGTDSM